jgi:hypothetical protein
MNKLVPFVIQIPICFPGPINLDTLFFDKMMKYVGLGSKEESRGS